MGVMNNLIIAWKSQRLVRWYPAWTLAVCTIAATENKLQKNSNPNEK